jgi:hypothetical protein
MDLMTKIKKYQYFKINNTSHGVIYISDGLIIQLCEHEILKDRDIIKIAWRLESFPECLLILGKILFKNSVSKKDEICIQQGPLLESFLSREFANIKIKVLLSSQGK